MGSTSGTLAAPRMVWILSACNEKLELVAAIWILIGVGFGSAVVVGHATRRSDDFPRIFKSLANPTHGKTVDVR